MAQLSDNTLTISTGTIDYIAFGSGTKPLIMIPGLSLRRVKGSVRAMSYAYRIFSKDYRVYMFDSRNEIKDAVTIEEMADDLYEAMGLCNITKADILGVSMGGMIAETLCVKHPETADRVILALTAARCTETTEERIRQWMSFAQKDDTDGLVRCFFEDLYTENYLRRYKPFMGMLVKIAEKSDLSRFMKQAEAILHFDVSDQLGQSNMDASVIGARNDRIVPYTQSQYIAAALGADCYIYENYGHGAFEEAKDFNARVLAALNKGRSQ